MSGEGTPVINTTDTSKVTVTYIGNSGFMITTCHKKILIDAVFVGIKYVYTLPEDIQNSLALAQPPFENVDLILVSHGHRDHYNRNLVQQHLEHNPNTAFASQSIFSSQFSSLPNQIIDLDPSPGKPVQTDLDGIQVKAFSLTHSDGQPPNIGFLIVVDGVKLFFPGDYDITGISFEEFRAYELPEENIDIAFIPHFDLTDGATEQQFVKEGIGAKYIIPFHYYYTNPTMNRKAVLGNYPDAIFFDKELASWEMPE
jgi:L-ascorbate metabolism protein UlaG (beta-lactamase superfamily)